MSRRFRVAVISSLLVTLFLATPHIAAEDPPGTEAVFASWVRNLPWRTVGPSAMGGRIVRLAVVESNPSTYFVASASGGVFKTVNGGVTFEPIFDDQGALSIGDVCVAPSDPRVVWVGTGEHNARNSVSWGNGVTRSLDGGKTWKRVGLEKSFQIGRIAIHPRNPDVVYVAALGRLWGSNAERGLYRTSDGGSTWEQVLYMDERTGCVDVVLAPDDPETVIAAMYDRQRDEFDGNDPAVRWGPGSGIYRSQDGGRHWERLWRGLPTTDLGRIGLAWSPRDPGTVFAIVETEKIGTGDAKAVEPAFMGVQGEDVEGGARLLMVVPDGPAARAGLRAGDLVSGFGGQKIASYRDLVTRIVARQVGDRLEVNYRRGEEARTTELTLGRRPATGRGGAGARPFGTRLGGQQANVQGKQGDAGFQTGGLFKSVDRGDSWQRINSLNPRPFYYSQVRVDPTDDHYLYVLGVAFHSSEDGGKNFRSDFGRGVHLDHHALWIDPRDGRHMILGGDGGLYETHDRGRRWEFVNTLPIGQYYHVAVDSRRLYRLYGGLQDNGTWGGPSAVRGTRGPTADDWFAISGGDGFVCQVDPEDADLVYYEAQHGRMGRIDLRSGRRAFIRPPSRRGRSYRFNWRTPFILSSHNPRIFYCAGNHVFRSLKRGDDLRVVSPAITRTNRGSATALSESPHDPDLLYAGTDDGFLWVTRDGTHSWQNVTENLRGVPGYRWVSSIEASRHVEGRVYVALDGHRSDDDAPYILVSEDFGGTWRSLAAGLPDVSTRVLREDLENPDLLYLGTEFGIWCSGDRGVHWTPLGRRIPRVPVHEIAVHPTAGEIVAATHGRGLWILDVSPLRQVGEKALASRAHLFRPQPAVLWAARPSGTLFGHKRFVGENPPSGAVVHYSLQSAAATLSLEVHDATGKRVASLAVKSEPGLHRSIWNLRVTRQPQRRTARQGPARRRPRGIAAPGTYRLVLTVDEEKIESELVVEADPRYPESPTVLELEDERLEEILRQRMDLLE